MDRWSQSFYCWIFCKSPGFRPGWIFSWVPCKKSAWCMSWRWQTVSYCVPFPSGIWSAKFPGDTTFCALEDSALPGVLVCNWHLLKQHGYSSFNLSSISSILPCLFFQNRTFALICIRLYWFISHVCYPAISCYTNEIFVLGKTLQPPPTPPPPYSPCFL